MSNEEARSIEDLARRVTTLENILKIRTATTVDGLEKVKQIICESFKLSPKEFSGKCRSERIVSGRRVFCYIARKMGHGQENIAKFIRPDMDHGTVSHHERIAQGWVEVDPHFAETVKSIAGLAGIKLEKAS